MELCFTLTNSIGPLKLRSDQNIRHRLSLRKKFVISVFARCPFCEDWVASKSGFGGMHHNKKCVYPVVVMQLLLIQVHSDQMFSISELV